MIMVTFFQDAGTEKFLFQLSGEGGEVHFQCGQDFVPHRYSPNMKFWLPCRGPGGLSLVTPQCYYSVLLEVYPSTPNELIRDGTKPREVRTFHHFYLLGRELWTTPVEGSIQKLIKSPTEELLKEEFDLVKPGEVFEFGVKKPKIYTRFYRINSSFSV